METQRFDFYKNSDYVFAYSILDGNYFIHCQVTKWTPSVLKSMYRTFAKFILYLNSLDVFVFYTVTPNPEFAKLFNGSSIGKVVDQNKECEVIKWELKSLS